MDSDIVTFYEATVFSVSHPLSTMSCSLAKTLKWSASTGTFGQSESWSIHISSSWKHPAVPYEVLIDPLSVPDCDVLNFKTDVSDAINSGKTETRGGEPKVSCITSQMIF